VRKTFEIKLFEVHNSLSNPVAQGSTNLNLLPVGKQEPVTKERRCQ
jgi:hypothetical protein